MTLISEILACYSEKEEKLNRLLTYYKNVPIFIFGNGLMSEKIEVWLRENGVQIDGHIVNPDYRKNANEKTMEEVHELHDSIVVVLGIAAPGLVAHYQSLFQNSSKIREIFCFGDNYPAGEAFISIDWIEEHSSQLLEVWESLQDENSKKSMINFLKAKMSGNASYLNEDMVVDKAGVEYFNEVLLDFSQEIFVDGGAYDGDTYREMIANQMDYTKYYGFEPDLKNYEKLNACIASDEKAKAVAKGLYEKEDVLCFSSSGTMSSKIVSEQEKGEQVPVTSIDILASDATFIKLDIEGAEMSALKGASETIRKNWPKLAICCYHSINDIWEIPLYIKSLCPHYKFYYRLYQRDWCRDLILYAYVDNEKEEIA